MPTHTSVSNPPDNRLLAALPRAECERLIPHLELVHLPRGKILFDAGALIRHGYFPVKGVIPLLGQNHDIHEYFEKRRNQNRLLRATFFNLVLISISA